MKKIFALAMAAVMSLTLAIGASPAFAGIGSSIPDNGKHYNLNIIGVQKGKSAPMDNPDRHTIFVSLGKDGGITTKITVKANTANPIEFEVIDGNGTDGEAIIAVPYTAYGTLSYNVYASALGKPNGSVHVDATAVFDDTTYDAGLLETSFDLARSKGKPTTINISNIFRASGWIDLNGDGIQDPTDTTFTNVWVFNVPTLLDYFWTYNNSGLKLMQVRFYETTSGTWTNVPAL